MSFFSYTYLDTPPPQPQPPPTTTATDPLRRSLYHAPPSATPWPSEMPPPATTATLGLRLRAGNNSPYHAREAPAVAEPRLRQAHVLVRDSRHPAGGDAGVFRPARLRRRPRRKAPAPSPESAARRRPPSDPTARWAARSRAAPVSAPLDGDDGAPGRGRLCPASGGIDHWPWSRPPWLSTTGIARGGGEGGATPGGGGGHAGGRGGGGEALQCAPPPRPRRGAAILVEGAWELHRKRWTTNKQQSKVDEGCLLTRGSQFCALTPPPQRRNLPLGLGGGGGRIQSGAERKGRGCDYHEVDDDEDNDGKGGKQGKKY